jgi:hypothetical protein
MKKDFKNIILITLFVGILGVSINVFAAGESCTGVFSSELLSTLNDYIYIPIKWATPILLLLLTSFDFAKIVFNGKKEDMDKAKSHFLKRFVAALIIFFAPDVVKLIVDLIQQNSIKSCLNNF